MHKIQVWLWEISAPSSHFCFESKSALKKNVSIFLKDFIYLFLERGEGKEKGRDASMCGCRGCLLSAPYWGPGLQLRHVPWLGIKLVTFWFTGWHSIHWATPARAECHFLNPRLIHRKIGPGRVPQLERMSARYLKVAGSILGQGTQKNQPMKA